jgi:hypothetical protein
MGRTVELWHFQMCPEPVKGTEGFDKLSPHATNKDSL